MPMRHHFQSVFTRGVLLLSVVLCLASSAIAHNLDQRDTSINFDDDYLNVMLAREELEQDLIQDGDEFWRVFRSTQEMSLQLQTEA